MKIAHLSQRELLEILKMIIEKISVGLHGHIT